MKNLNYQSLPHVAIAENAATPNPGIAGVFVWSTTASKILLWNASNWVAVAGSSGGGVTVSDTAPVSPTEGMQWFNTTNGIQYTRVGTAWVEPGGQQILSGSSASPILHWMF